MWVIMAPFDRILRALGIIRQGSSQSEFVLAKSKIIILEENGGYDRETYVWVSSGCVANVRKSVKDPTKYTLGSMFAYLSIIMHLCTNVYIYV